MASAPNHMMDAAWAPCISSLPFPPSSSLTPPVFTSSVSLFGKGRLSGPTTWCCTAASSVLPSWHWHYIHTDIILGKVLFPFLFHSFILLSLSPPPPAVVSTGTLFSSIPRSFLYTATAKQTPGTLWSKQPASCAVAPSVDSLRREQSVPLLLLCFVLFSPPWDLHSTRWLPSDGCNVLEQWLGCFLQQEC